MKKILIVSALAVALAGCGSTPATSTSLPITNKPVTKTVEKKTFVYAPQGREEFVFDEISEKLQEYHYRDVCYKMPKNSVSTECLLNKLDYDKYVGKKGYYTDREPFKDLSKNVVREAVLETGETVYLVFSEKYKRVGGYFISKDKHDEIANFKPEPIIDGASVMITGYSEILRDNLTVSSQKNHSYSKEEIETIRKVANQYPKNKVAIAELLTTLKVDFDNFSGRTRISGMPYNSHGSYLSVNIVVEDGKAYPFMKAFYKADDWLFVKSFTTSADGDKWTSGKVDFERDHSSGTIWEWSVEPLDNESTEMLEKMAFADSAIIRYHGSKYYDDHILSEKQKSELKRLVELVKLMK
jgi:hypothetical protein